MFERVIGSIGASIGPENFNAVDMDEDDPWNEDDMTEPVAEHGDTELTEVV